MAKLGTLATVSTLADGTLFMTRTLPSGLCPGPGVTGADCSALLRMVPGLLSHRAVRSCALNLQPGPWPGHGLQGRSQSGSDRAGGGSSTCLQAYELQKR